MVTARVLPGDGRLGTQDAEKKGGGGAGCTRFLPFLMSQFLRVCGLARLAFL